MIVALKTKFPLLFRVEDDEAPLFDIPYYIFHIL